MSDKIEALLNFDPLAEAEKVTGKSYKDDKDTGLLGCLLNMTNSKMKDSFFKSSNDTTFSCSIDEYLRILMDLGFVKIYEEEFHDDKHISKENSDEIYYIYWHPVKAIIASIDTFNRKERNSSVWYFSFKPKDYKYFWSNFRCSGHFWSKNKDVKDDSELIWVGNWDAREGIRHKMKKLDDSGSFVNPWPEPQFLQINHYGDRNQNNPDHDYSYSDSQRKRRFNLLPDNIKISCGGDCFPK